MPMLFDLVRLTEPYGKIIEYGLIVAALLAAIYATKRVYSATRGIQKCTQDLVALEKRLPELSARMLQAATDVLETAMEERIRPIVNGLTAQLADLVERGRGQSPEKDDQEAPSATQEQEQSTTDDAYEAHKRWWQPVVDMKFDAPGQDPPTLRWMNNVRAKLPWPSTWLTAWCNDSPNGVCGVALSGRGKRIDELWRRLRRDADQIQQELPEGSTVQEGRFGIGLIKPNAEFKDDEERRAWLKETLNTFVNVLRPRILKAVDRSNRRGDALAEWDWQRPVT